MTVAPPAEPGTGSEPPPPTPPPAATVRKKSHRIRYIGVGAVLVGAVVFLLVEGLGSSLNYYLPVNQAVHEQAKLGTSNFRLEGVVVPGSVRTTPDGVNFTVESNGVSEPVVNTGSPPQLFQPNIPVVVVGHFQGGEFTSNQILVKHTATYIAAHPQRVTAPNGTKR